MRFAHSNRSSTRAKSKKRNISDQSSAAVSNLYQFYSHHKNNFIKLWLSKIEFRSFISNTHSNYKFSHAWQGIRS